MGLNSWLRGKKQTGPSEITNLVHRMFAGTWATLTGPSEFLLGDRIGCDPLLFCVYADFDYGVTVAGMRFAEAYVPKDERDSVLFDFLQSFKNDLRILCTNPIELCMQERGQSAHEAKQPRPEQHHQANA
jgi:hypothetical protein